VPRPAIEASDGAKRRAESAFDKDVITASLGHCRAEFGDAECRRDDENRRDDERHDNRRSSLRHRDTRKDENPAADHRSHADRDHRKEPKISFQILSHWSRLSNGS